jgi:hypothetical protein
MIILIGAVRPDSIKKAKRQRDIVVAVESTTCTIQEDAAVLAFTSPCNNMRNTLTMRFSDANIAANIDSATAVSASLFIPGAHRSSSSAQASLLSFFAGLHSADFGHRSQNQPPSPAPAPPLVLVGGTIIDVTDWGHSANDIQDAVVYIRDGRILAVGPRALCPFPKARKVIDCTGKYLIPGLIDGFAGMNSQGQASANLYMGVTTVVAAQRRRRRGKSISTPIPARISICRQHRFHRRLEPAHQSPRVGEEAQGSSRPLRRTQPRRHRASTGRYAQGWARASCGWATISPPPTPNGSSNTPIRWA